MLDASFFLKFDPLPPQFRLSKLDKLWFNKFSSFEVAEETFWTTVLHACDNGVNLKSCEGYSVYAANLLVNYEAQDEITKDALKSNLGAIMRALIKLNEYDSVMALMRVNNPKIAEKAQLSLANIDHQHNFTVLENIAESIGSEKARNQFIDSLVHLKGPSLALIYMKYRPEALYRFVSRFEFYALYDGVSQLIFKSYRPGMDHELVYEFKRALIERHYLPISRHHGYFSAVAEYLHRDVGLTELPALDDAEKAELALVKGKLPQFFNLIGSLAIETFPDNFDDFSHFKLILDKPEIIRALLKLDSRFFKGYFRVEFERNRSNDPSVRKLLHEYVEYYADSPGTHEGILIYPGLQNDSDSESDAELLNYLEDEISHNRIRKNISETIIRTIMLTKHNYPQVIERSILGLIDNAIVELIPFTSSSKIIIWYYANFETFTKLLANERIVNFALPYFSSIDWDLTDYVKIFRFPEYFNIYYPHRKVVAKIYLKKFSTSQLLHHFLSLEEFEAMLEFFDYDFHVPENLFSFNGHSVEVAKKEMAREYKVVTEYCGKDMKKSMQHLNSYLLDSSMIWSEDKMRECEKILESWCVNPLNYRSLRRFLEVAKLASKVPILRVKISSLRIDPETLIFLTEQESRVQFNFDLEAILAELQSISRSDYLGTLTNINSTFGLYVKLMTTSGYPAETMNKLKRFLKGNRD